MALCSKKDDALRLQSWMDRRNIETVRVVSPHLDDAVFSLAEFLTRSGLPSCTVLTVFTHAGDRTSDDYALTIGFRDAEDEFECRRLEDLHAMNRLGVPFIHCGAKQGHLDTESADIAASQVLNVRRPDRTLILLPLGAGSVFGPFRRFARRLLRRPVGSGVHHEHVWVRDRIWDRAKPIGAVVGYYAEVPYAWTNDRRDLIRLAKRLDETAACFTLLTDVDRKLAASSDYTSQIEAEFGTHLGFQRRTAAIPERIYLPA